MTRPVAPATAPRQVGMRYNGRTYMVPSGGWVSRAMVTHPGLRTTVITNRTTVVNRVVNVRNYYANMWGNRWYSQPRGFYSSRWFWYSYVGSLLSYNYSSAPLYVVSPVSGYDCGQIQPTSGRFTDEKQALLSQLRLMATESNVDKAAGLYAFADSIDPQNPGPRLTPEGALDRLKQNQGIVFHPPNGAYETISSLDELRAYVYSREDKPQ